MKFIAISDTHCRHRNLKLPKGDVLLHAGDISSRGHINEVQDFLEWFDRQPYQHKIFIAGNHDFFFERETDTAIKKIIPPSVTYLKDEEIIINGIRIWGSPYTPWFFNWAFNVRRGEPLAIQWKKIPAGVDVLLTHGPVYGILDRVVNGEHAGDKELLEKLLELKPKLHICGHIHEAYGVTKRHDIKFINASVLNESYELTNKPIVFDL